MSQPGRSTETRVHPTIDKQEQKRIELELRKRNMFEDYMSLEVMQELWSVLMLSEQTSNVKGQHTAENKNVEPVSPVMPRTYAQKVGGGGGALSTAGRKSMSPELSGVHQNKRLLQEKSADSSDDSVFSHPATSPNPKESREPPNVNKNKSRSSPNIANTNEGMNNNNKRSNQRQNNEIRQEDRWLKFKINPLDFISNAKDTDLTPHNRSFNSRVDSEGASGGTSVNNEHAMQAILYSHLRNTSEICHNKQSSSVVANIQWGTAIKIGEVKGSFDTKCLSDEKITEFDDDKNQPEAATSFGVSDERRRRRKLCTNNTSIYDYANDSGDEQDSNDEDFRLKKKRQKNVSSSIRKKTSGTRNRAEPASTSKRTTDVAVEKKQEDHVTSIDVSDQCASTDDETKDEPPKKVRRSKSVETEDIYPRRIVPPKPGSKWINVRARKPLDESRISKKTQDQNEENTCTMQKNKSSVGLQEEDIAKALKESDEDDNDDSVTPNNDNIVDIRPLRISSRMKMQSQRLVQLQEKEKKIEIRCREQERMKEEKIRHEKIERVQQRLKEEKIKQKVQEELEKQKAEREKEWNNYVAQGSKKRTVERIDLYPDGRPQNNEILQKVDEKKSITVDSDDEFINDNGPSAKPDSNQVRCPICNKAFAANEIEAHAGACEEYDDCPPGMSRSSTPSLTPEKKASNVQRSSSSVLFECEICEKFATYNGKQFENHMAECLNRKKYGEPFMPDTIVAVSTSPIRTVRMISEQTDSEINYKSQFAPKTKSNKTVGKKRKR